MIAYIVSIAMMTFLFAAIFIIIKKEVVTSYRGGVMIVMSCLYFTMLFLLAHVMREGFK